MVHNKELVRRHELARGKIGETILLNKMRKIKKIEREREGTTGYIPLDMDRAIHGAPLNFFLNNIII